jgi:hypothetical protein
MIAYEGASEGEPDYTNETSRRHLVMTAIGELNTYIAGGELDSANVMVVNNTWATMAAFAEDAHTAQTHAFRVADPVRRLPALAEVANRFQNPVLEEYVYSEAASLLRSDIQLSDADHDCVLDCLVDIAVLFRDTKPLDRDNIENDELRDLALARYIKLTEDLTPFEKIGSCELRDQGLATSLVQYTAGDLDIYLDMLPTIAARDDALALRANTRYDLAAAERITNPNKQADVLLRLAERTEGRLLAEKLPELLVQQLAQSDNATEYDPVRAIMKYVDITGNPELLEEVRTIIESRPSHNISTIAQYVARTGDVALAQKAVEEIDRVLNKQAKPKKSASARKTVNPDFDDDFRDLAIGLNDPALAGRIVSDDKREDALLRIALQIESIDPILSIGDVESRSAVVARYFIARSELGSVIEYTGFTLQQREQAIIDIAIRRGDPDIAALYISDDDAAAKVMDALLDPTMDFLMPLDKIPLVEDPDIRLVLYTKHYLSGDTNTLWAMLEEINGYSVGYRYEDLDMVAKLTGDVVYAYRALYDWVVSTNDSDRMIEWGVYLLDATRVPAAHKKT